MNQYELIEYLSKKIIEKSLKHINAEQQKLISFASDIGLTTKKMNELRYEANSLIQESHCCWERIRKYDEQLKARENALQDRENNLQKIYDKMLEIEMQLKTDGIQNER